LPTKFGELLFDKLRKVVLAPFYHVATKAQHVRGRTHEVMILLGNKANQLRSTAIPPTIWSFKVLTHAIMKKLDHLFGITLRMLRVLSTCRRMLMTIMLAGATLTIET